MAALPLYLNGKLVAGEGVPAVVRAPFDGRVAGEVSQASAGQVESAIAGMVAAREKLAALPAYRRAEMCTFLQQALTSRAEEFARTIALEAGKPIRTARGEVQRAIATFKLAAEEATRSGPGSGERLPVDIDPRGEGYWAMVERFPIGPCSFITPFNFPLNLVAHKVAPALACGCPFVIKPSEKTPLTALLLGEILVQAFAAVKVEGGWSVLPCDRTVAAPLVTDERIKLLSFTGSPEVGFKMKSQAGKKQVVLELGNNSAVIVEPETDKVMSVPRIVNGAFGYAGQSCISVQRIYLHESIAERMTEMLASASEKLVVGDPLEEKTDVGPVIDAAAAERIMGRIEESGGEIICGGRREGNLIWPTLVAGAEENAKLVREEVFGPVAVIETYRDFGDVLRRVNDSRFGLQAGLFSQDQRKIRRAFEELEVGGVVINDVPTTRFENMPYGGVKDSGVGREGVKYAMEHMTERRVMVVRKG